METLVSSPGALSPSTAAGALGATNGVSGSHFTTVDPTLVAEHLAKLIEANLGATRRELESIGSLLSKPKQSDTIQRCTRFATESQVALYVQKDVIPAAGKDGGGGMDKDESKDPRGDGGRREQR